MADRDHRVHEYPARSRDIQRPTGEHDRRSGSGRRRLGLAALLVLVGGLAVGIWRHYALHLEVTAAAEQHRDFVPTVRVEAVRASRHDERDIAGHHQRFRSRQHLCPRQRVYHATQCRYRVAREGGRLAGGDYRSGTRSPDRPGRGQPGSGQGITPANQGQS